MRRPAAVLGVLLACAGASAPRQALVRGESASAEQDLLPLPRTERQLLDRLERAWKARDVDGYLALWFFRDPAARVAEREFAEAHLASQESTLRLSGARPGSGAEIEVHAETFSIAEPRARLDQWRLRLTQRPDGWVLGARDSVSSIEGLMHLSLDRAAYQAAGLTLRLEDFELTWTSGALFTSPAELGPTAMVFVGEGVVRVRPQPPTEQDQLRQFCGAPAMEERVRSAFLRIHPADLHRVMTPARFDPIQAPASAFERAERFYRAHAQRSFVLDASLPRSPWWLMPSLGDAAVSFETRKRGTLTFTISGSEAESISLFDRQRRLQILLYPHAGRDTDYDEDDGRSVDLIAHDLQLRFDPLRYGVRGEDTLRLNLLQPGPTLRLRLDDSLKVLQVVSAYGEHVFFRVRDQNSVMVALGPLSGFIGEVQLTVRYEGSHQPAAVERELLQAQPAPTASLFGEEETILDPVLVYSNRTAWYPNPDENDFATARIRIDVPLGFHAATGGVHMGSSIEGDRVLIEYRQDLPGKYISVALGRMQAGPTRTEGSVTLETLAVARQRGELNRVLELAAAMLRFFERSFGPCPYPVLRLALIEERAPGGHSPPGMIVLATRPMLLRGALRDDPAGFTDVPGFFLAHELAHQWWGHGIAGQNYRERWLSEAFAHYAAALWTRESLGEERFRDVLGRMGRWALRESDEGPIHLGHRLGHLKGDAQIYRAVVYDKGAYVLHMLRGILGDEAFFQGLRAFQSQHRFQKTGTTALRQALEQASGKTLEPYFRQWVHGVAIPELEIAQRTAGGSPRVTQVDVRASQLPGPVPLEVVLPYAGGVARRTVTLEPKGGSFLFETPSAPRKAEVNADRGLLARLERR